MAGVAIMTILWVFAPRKIISCVSSSPQSGSWRWGHYGLSKRRYIPNDR